MSIKVGRTLVGAIVLIGFSASPAFATDASTPVPAVTSSTSAAPIGPVVTNKHIIASSSPLNRDQRAALISAKKTLANSLKTAKSTFNLFLADAQANRDQAILAANGDAKAKALAKVQFQNAVTIARQTMQSAIAQANQDYASTVSKLGIAPTPAK